ncbi:hypothetical protein HFP89_00305 [Wenzhouxiangella sp. XN79A]|uniref:asparagine synthase-related protein n=1 Tax=Wenzhouxiangella sp. XN79A TaxID=2724193 RepID=UPI00144A5835|nr:asparagine synthetase B family protein [Wenzhouxiangella sp. XN79A]NKI33604.1 hypothetical protein [Wenzhouxiangella sp. XN79A]
MLIALYGTLDAAQCDWVRQQCEAAPAAGMFEASGCVLAADRIHVTEDWVAAWEGWPYSDAGLNDSIERMLDSGVSDIAGQFNLVVFDRRRNELIVLRDLAGSYTLYQASRNKRVCLTSRVEQAERLLNTRFPLSLQRLRAMHQRAEYTPPRSHFAGIELVEPDQVIRWSRNRESPRSILNTHWIETFVRNAKKTRSKNDVLETLAGHLSISLGHASEGVQNVLQVSGGLDSNLLLHAMVSAGLSTRAITFVFPGMDCDESVEARLSAERAGVVLDEFDLSRRRFADDRDALFSHCDVLPFTTTYFTTETARCARDKGASVILSGVGGDEIFWTHRRKAMGILVRGVPGGAFRFAYRSPMLYARGVARVLVSGRARSLRRALMQGYAIFYMAAAQEADWYGCSFRAPFRDALVLTAALPAASRHCLAGGSARGLQRNLLEHFSPGLSEIVGVRKPTFGSAARAEPIECPELGEAARDNIAALAPSFIEIKRMQGVFVE